MEREFWLEVKRIVRSGIFDTFPYDVEDIVESECSWQWLHLVGMNPYEAAALMVDQVRRAMLREKITTADLLRGQYIGGL